MLIDNISMDKDEVRIFKNYLTSDLKYYKSGIDILNKLENAKDNVEFSKIIEDNNLPSDWTPEDVTIRKTNTIKLVGVLENVITSINYKIAIENM